MAITFTNVFKDKILDTIRSFLNDKFASAISIYTGNFKNMGNQSIRLTPVGNELVRYTTTGEVREYSVEIAYYLKEKSIKGDFWAHLLRQISIIENLFDDNTSNTYFNGKLASMVINDKTDEEEAIDGLNVVKWDFNAMYINNVS